MSIKPVGLSELLKGFEGYVSSADLLAARLLAKISAAITKKRIDLEMNQSEFAKLLNVSQGMVSKWESKNYNYTIEGLSNICDKLDMSLDVVIKPHKNNFYSYQQFKWNTTVATTPSIKKSPDSNTLKKLVA